MNLAQFFQQNFIKKAAFARSIGVSPSLLHQWIKGIRPVPVPHCQKINEKTDRKVGLKDLRPKDWKKIWPDLADAPPTLSHANPNGSKKRETQIPVQRGMPKSPS